MNSIKYWLRTLYSFVRNQPKKYFDFYYLRWHGVEVKFGEVELKGLPIISKCRGSRIILKNKCTLISKSKYNIAGINHPVILATLTPKAEIIVEGAGISGCSICAAERIFIGQATGLGANVCIYDTDFHPIDPISRMKQVSILDANCSEVRIGRSVWIAANSIVLKGVTIGDGAVVGAGSVVTTSIPEKAIFAGNPAKWIRNID